MRATKREPSRPRIEGGALYSASTIDPNTIQAYRETEYRVLGDSLVVLHVDEANPALLALHHRQNVSSSAFITACNPYSQVFDAHSNANRQAALAEELRGRQLHFLPGVGQHPSNQWPGEDSFLVFGLSLEDSEVLAHRLEQNGFVWSGPDALPQLILLK